MNTIIERSLLFPRINEDRVKCDKVTKAHQIKSEILSQMLKNSNVSSLYTLRTEPLNASVSISGKKSVTKVQKRLMEGSSIKDSNGKILSKRQIQDFSRRNSICISDLPPHKAPSLVSKRLIHENEEANRSLQTIRNNLKMKILKFKTQMNVEEKNEHSLGQSRQFREIFSIRSISTSIKAKNAMQYRLQAKKFFKNHPQTIKISVVPDKQRQNNPKINELKMTSINGWVIEEEDLTSSNNICENPLAQLINI